MFENGYPEMDFGLPKPAPRAIRKVEVSLNPGQLMGLYAQRFVDECKLANPNLFEVCELDPKDVEKYFKFLLFSRVEATQLRCKDFTRVRAMVIPKLLQQLLSMVGDVIIRERGLHYTPVMKDPKVDVGWASEISYRIGAFENDIPVLPGGMPKGGEGLVDFMTSAILNGQVVMRNETAHPITPILVGLAGSTLVKEEEWAQCYDFNGADLSHVEMIVRTDHALYR